MHSAQKRRKNKMTQDRLYLDVHAIQTLPPSNINRDDVGSPKSVQYGGVQRARVSSQSWKRAMRSYFYDNSLQKNLGVRTVQIVRYIAEKIMEKDSSMDCDKAMALADKAINGAGIKTTKDKKTGDKIAKALFFMSDQQAEALAEKAVEGNFDKAELQELLNDNLSIDIALFGRMAADAPILNTDASSQVAHAISTHSIQSEFDFFTAVDDLKSEESSGAGMVSTLEFNAPTLYRYANVAVHELAQQLGNKQDTVDTLKLFVESFSNSLPTGKVNSFANQTLPQLLLVTLRSDRPISLVSAFESPVKSREGYVSESIERLFAEMTATQKFVETPVFATYLTTVDVSDDSQDISEAMNLSNLCNDLGEKLTSLLNEIEGE